MCGIFWYKILNHQNIKKIEENFYKIQHRGPENSTIKIFGDNFLGHHRLSIINPNKEGNQPFEHNNSFLVCNGQIYNYKELNKNKNNLKSDCHIISYLFDEGNSLEEIAYKLDGDFAFIYIKDDIINVARDPVGVRPLFYGTDENNNVICFASEVKAICGLEGVVNCQVFPPGHYWDSKTNKFQIYTDIYTTEDEIPKYIEKSVALNIIRDGLTNAVKKRVEHTDRPIAFLCSGGIDSSIIFALSHQIIEQKNKTEDIEVFSIQFENNGRTNSDDAFYAQMLVNMYGVKYTPVKFTWDDVKENLDDIILQIESYDPNTIRASVPMYFLAKYIKEKTEYKVILSGEGADEIFMGYNIFMNVNDKKQANKETERLVRNIHMFDGLRADRTFAAHGLELRVPFLDIDFVKNVFKIDGNLKMYQNGIEKAILREAFEDINELKMSRVLDRQKERFSDGCGFDYVPMLLKHCCNNKDISILTEKERNEKEKYKNVFNKKYENLEHLIIKRENPVWVSNNKEQKLLAI